MVNLHSLPNQSAKAQERTREADHPSSLVMRSAPISR